MIGDGRNTRFWEENWLDDAPLAKQYPSLNNIVQRKQVFVADALSYSPLIIAFRCTLPKINGAPMATGSGEGNAYST
jgi:hypothetical protein